MFAIEIGPLNFASVVGPHVHVHSACCAHWALSWVGIDHAPTAHAICTSHVVNHVPASYNQNGLQI